MWPAEPKRYINADVLVLGVWFAPGAGETSAQLERVLVSDLLPAAWAITVNSLHHPAAADSWRCLFVIFRQRLPGPAESQSRRRVLHSTESSWGQQGKETTQEGISAQPGESASDLTSVSSLAAQVDTRVPAAHEVQGHRSQQQNLLWEWHPPDVCGLWLCRELHKSLCSHGRFGRSDPGPGLSAGTHRRAQGWRTICWRAGAWLSPPSGLERLCWPGPVFPRHLTTTGRNPIESLRRKLKKKPSALDIKDLSYFWSFLFDITENAIIWIRNLK